MENPPIQIRALVRLSRHGPASDVAAEQHAAGTTGGLKSLSNICGKLRLFPQCQKVFCHPRIGEDDRLHCRLGTTLDLSDSAPSSEARNLMILLLSHPFWGRKMRLAVFTLATFVALC